MSHKHTAARTIRIAVGAFFFVSGFGFASFASRIADIQQNLQLTHATLGTALFAMPLGLLFTMPLTNFLLGKYTSRTILLLGSVANNVLLLLLGFVTSWWQLLVLLFFFGASRNLMNVPVNAQSVGVQSLYQQSIIARFHAIWSVSGFLAAFIAGLLIQAQVGITLHFSLVSVVCLVVIAIFYRHTFKEALPQTHQQKVFVLPKGNVLKVGLIAFAAMSCEGTMYDWSSVYFADVVHASSTQQTWGYTAFMCAAALVRFLGDWMVNKWGIKPVMLGCGIITFVGFVIAVAFPFLHMAILGFALTGFGIGCIVPFAMLLAGKMADKQTVGQSVAGVSTIGYLGFLLGPPMMGYIAEWKSLQWSFAVSGLTALVLVWLVGKIKLEK